MEIEIIKLPTENSIQPIPMAEDGRLEKARKLLSARCGAEARDLFQQLINEGKHLENAKLGYGVSYVDAEQWQAAVDYFEACGCFEPEIAFNLSFCYEKLNNKPKAIETLLRSSRTRQRRFDGIYRKLAGLGMDTKDLNVQFEALSNLFEMYPEDFDISWSLAEVCSKLKKLKLAATYYLKCLELVPDDPSRQGNCHMCLSGIYKDNAEQKKAAYHFSECARLSGNAAIVSNQIMMLQYTHAQGMPEFYKLGHKFSDLSRSKSMHKHPISTFQPERSENLSIGFVGGDFNYHSLSNLLLEPFKQLKKVSKFKYYIYSCRENEDHISEQYKQSVDVWRNITKLSDADAAKTIAEDNIDILFDISGHTALNRLPVFAYYPAAVQAGWVCGMMTPAGIESINYFLTDPYMNPQVPTPEKLIELPSAYSYFPLVTTPDINLSLPVDRKKRLTLLAPNNPCKISDAVIKVWSDCLKALPESDLIIKIYGQDTEFRLKREFAKLQVDPNRIKSLYTIDKLEDLLSFYTNEVDIVLDTWPCTGCLTSAEVMWMGVPVITMIGNTFLHRQTWTILKQTHTEELGADTDVGYVQALVSLASNRNRMLKFRTDIRGLMNAAPIRQPEVIATAIVKACQSIWLDACETKHSLMEKILV